MKTEPKSRKRLRHAGIAAGLTYGLIARFAFGFEFENTTLFSVMSSSFIIGVPLALGFLTAWFREPDEKQPWRRALMSPWVSSLLFMAACLCLLWEGIICVFLWVPLLCVLSSIGGLLGEVAYRAIKRQATRTSCVALVCLLPFVAAPLENLTRPSEELRTVSTSIRISGSPESVWRQIRSVPKIQKSEHSFQLVHALGFPKPVEAELEGTGIGAVRKARFEGNVLFVETITEWKENQRLSFSIKADTQNIPPTTFDEHVTIGGPFFDVLEGTYEIESLPDGTVMLHLSSTQRLSTRFNFYSHWWTEYLMADLQDYILRIIRARVEKETAT